MICQVSWLEPSLIGAQVTQNLILCCFFFRSQFYQSQYNYNDGERKVVCNFTVSFRARAIASDTNGPCHALNLTAETMWYTYTFLLFKKKKRKVILKIKGCQILVIYSAYFVFWHKAIIMKHQWESNSWTRPYYERNKHRTMVALNARKLYTQFQISPIHNDIIASCVGNTWFGVMKTLIYDRPFVYVDSLYLTM